MRILFLTQYYRPEPVTFMPDFARYLRDNGHEVTVLTSVPCYPRGAVYEGYRQRLIQEETIDGIRVIRVPQLPDHSTSSLRRSLYYFSFMLSAMTLGNIRIPKIDVVFVYQAALTAGFAGTFLARLRRVPSVQYVVDLWPESVTASGMLRNRLANRLLKGFSNVTYRSADLLIGVTAGFVRRFHEIGISEERTRLVHYWMPPADTHDDPPADLDAVLPVDGKFRVAYAGNMGPPQNLASVIEAAHLLRDERDVEFVFIGDGLDLPALQSKVDQMGLANVRFLGRRPAAAMPSIYRRTDALLVHLKPDALSRVSIPSKTFSYMIAARPVIMAVEGDATALVEEHRFGLTARPSDPADVARAVLELRNLPSAERAAMGQRGADVYQRKFTSEVQAPRLAALIESVAHGRGRARSTADAASQ